MRVLVFDSGIGGLGVAREIRRHLPGAALTYLMDDAGFPYGGRTDPDLAARIRHVIAAGVARARPDMVVIACNTASTVALATLRADHALPFVGCVPPVKSAAGASVTKVIGILATPATVRGTYLHELSAQVAPGCRILVHGASGLAALAEARFAGAAVALSDVRAQIRGLVDQPGAAGLDAVALGCTHYALLLDDLRACLPAHVAWFDPAPSVARQAARVAAGLAGTGSCCCEGLVLCTGGTRALGPGWGAAGFIRAERLLA